MVTIDTEDHDAVVRKETIIKQLKAELLLAKLKLRERDRYYDAYSIHKNSFWGKEIADCNILAEGEEIEINLSNQEYLATLKRIGEKLEEKYSIEVIIKIC